MTIQAEYLKECHGYHRSFGVFLLSDKSFSYHLSKTTYCHSPFSIFPEPPSKKISCSLGGHEL